MNFLRGPNRELARQLPGGGLFVVVVVAAAGVGVALQPAFRKEPGGFVCASRDAGDFRKAGSGDCFYGALAPVPEDEGLDAEAFQVGRQGVVAVSFRTDDF